MNPAPTDFRVCTADQLRAFAATTRQRAQQTIDPRAAAKLADFAEALDAAADKQDRRAAEAAG